MANCIMCGKPVDNYPGYVTDGVIHVCNDCASSNSLMRIMTRIENLGLSDTLKMVFSPLIEVGLVDQTGERVELDKGKLDAKRELNEKYGMTVHASTNKDKYQPGSDYMNGDKAYLESGLVDQIDEHELEGDIENMSQDDFYSKYADNLDALNAYHDVQGEPSDFIEV